MTAQRARIFAAAGVFASLLGVYLLTSPGRIDFIDGQYRYEVARSWLDVGAPVIRDTVLRKLGAPVDPRSGESYAMYNAAPSLTPVPLMWIARKIGGDAADRDRFAFSLTSALFGAAVPALLVIAYGRLGIGLALSVAAAMVFAIATQWWPASVTTFDQNQHAFVLLVALLLAWDAGRRMSVFRALLAGVAGGLLINYQETYVLLLPAIALALFAPANEGTPDAPRPSALEIRRDALGRCLAFVAGTCVGVGLFVAYNLMRWGALLQPDRYQPQWVGDPLAGLLSLTLSPGRSVLLFSPPMLVLAFGVRALWTRAPLLCVAAFLTVAMHLIFIASLPFFGGEWAWGPRYLLVVLPLASLALPFAMSRVPRRFLATVIAAGVVVQVLAVSLDHQRFYFERNLAPFFWAERPWFYFATSQLFARPFELGATLRSGMPAEAVTFAPTPQSQLTYAPFGPPRPQQGVAWARRYAVFHVLRPWPLWMRRIDVTQRPVPLVPMTAACAVVSSAGVGLLVVGLRRGS